MGQGADVVSDGARLVVRLAGEMDAEAADAFVAGVSTEARSVTVDLAALDHVSLGAVRAFLRLGRALKASDHSLDFIEGSEGVRHAFEQAGFHDLFAFSPPLHTHRGHHDDDTP